MKLKFTVLFLMLISFSYSNAAKYKYWLEIKDSSFVYKDGKGTKYVYPQKDYTYVVKTNSNIQGSGVGKFTIKTTNGKKSGDVSTQFDVNENIEFSVQWNDIVDTCNVKIDKAEPYALTSDTLTSKTPIRFSYRIASLKGQTPIIGISSNPPIGTKQSITAEIITEATYPNLYKPYNILSGWVNLPAEYYEWSLPANWTAAGQTGTTFILGADQKSITITPNYVTVGEIKVRALNALKTAGSETKSNALNRGFSFTNFPSSPIPFGQTSTYTFAVTPVSGVTFEWEVPSGWQINGQGNVLEGVNLNSMNVTTSSFCSNSSVVRVRLKKNAEVSGWFTCIYPGVSQPIITSTTSPVYQYENASLSISNIPPSIISSVNWSGDGVVTTSSQGAGAKLVFTKSGLISLTAAVLLNGCSTPIPYKKDVLVSASRLSLTGSSQLCTQEIYSVTNLPSENTVSWSATPSGIASLQPNGNSVTLTKVGGGKVTLSATINNSFTITKDVGVGAPKLMSYTTTPKQLCAGEPFIFNAVIPDGSTITSATGLSEGTEIPLSTINSTSYEVPGDVSRITLSIENSCGDVTVRKLIPKANCLDFSFSMSPNPASNNTTISMLSPANANISTLLSASASSSVSTSYSVSVLDAYGSIVYTGKKNGSQFTIPTASLRNGVYSVIVSDGTNTYQNKLIVKH